MKGSKGLLLLGEPSFLLFQALILAPYPKGARQGWKERAFEARNKLSHPLTAKVVSPSQRTKGEELPQVLTRTARPLRSKNQHARACGRIRCDEKLFNSEVWSTSSCNFSSLTTYLGHIEGNLSQIWFRYIYCILKGPEWQASGVMASFIKLIFP